MKYCMERVQPCYLGYLFQWFLDSWLIGNTNMQNIQIIKFVFYPGSMADCETLSGVDVEAQLIEFNCRHKELLYQLCCSVIDI